MLLSQIESDIRALEQDASLREERHFDERARAIELLEFQIIGHTDDRIRSHAERIKSELEEIDNRLFEKLQQGIIGGKYKGKAFFDLVSHYFDLTEEVLQTDGYDNLDIFINRLLSFGDLPQQTRPLEPEMVYYQKTPARLIFELAKKIHGDSEDVFVDIGSGLGQVTMLINLLTGVKSVGIEFEPGFCDYAIKCAKWLNLPDVSFINRDAREADYSRGTIFFMYTPFWGEMLRRVLGLLRHESLQRKITIVTYGPCSAEVGKQNWLKAGINWIALG